MAKAAAQDVVIGAVERTKRREEIRVSVRHGQHGKVLDLRIWIEDPISGKMIPTPRGMALNPSEWTQLKAVLGKLKKGGQAGVDKTPT
jgi:Transcriptional Coactivator p15 (PC4)